VKTGSLTGTYSYIGFEVLANTVLYLVPSKSTIMLDSQWHYLSQLHNLFCPYSSRIYHAENFHFASFVILVHW